MERYGFLGMLGGVQDIHNNRFQLMFVYRGGEGEGEEGDGRKWTTATTVLEIDEEEKRSLILMGIPMEYPDHFLEAVHAEVYD